MRFAEKLANCVKKNNSLLCIGLDPEIEKIPPFLQEVENPLFAFNKEIIDKTHDLVCVYKPNSAFYEAHGVLGIKQLQMTCEYINSTYPDIPVIVDAKRGDIGNSNEGYARYAFDYLQADAVTVNPYLGIEALSVYFNRADKGIIIIVHSSNPGAKEFQELSIDTTPLYEIVAKDIAGQYGNNPDCMIVMGATYPQQLGQVRRIVGDMTILIPGIGTQGGSIEDTIRISLNSQKQGIMVNASRSIIFAGSDQNFAEKARNAAENLRVNINVFRV
jgi:orotidine-5'-phosphate decarboxylase